jgi:hypothetical protein
MAFRHTRETRAWDELKQKEYAITQAAKKPQKYAIGQVIDGFPVVGYVTNAGVEKRYLVLSTNGDRVELGRPDRKPFEVSKYRGPVYGFWVNEKAITREPEEAAQELAQEPANEAARQPA